MSRSASRSPAYIALSCVALSASPALAQDASKEAQGPTLGSVTVTDTALEEPEYKVDRPASPKYTAPLLDTPKSIVVLPAQVIRESGSTTFVEALRTVPGITFGAGEGGNPQGDRPFIRGFDAQGSTFIDGVRSVGGQSREVFAIEQIEVVKGSDSTMGGRGSAGGSLNLVSKMPHLGFDALADLSYGTQDYKRATVDANAQIGESSAVRLNAMWHDADVSRRDVVTTERWGVSPSIALGLGTETRGYLNFYHLQSDDIPDPGIPFERTAAQATSPDLLKIGPAEVVNGREVDRRTFYGLANRDFRKTNVDEALFRFERDLSDTIRLRTTAKYANVKQSYIITQPDDSQGNVAQGLVWRRANTRWSDVDSMVGQIDLAGSVYTGTIKHTFAAGFEGSWERSNRGSYVVNTNVAAGAPAAERCSTANQAAFNCTSLFTPNPFDPWANIPAGGTAGVPVTRTPTTAQTEATTYALYAFDTIEITEALLLNLGLRHDWYDTKVRAISATVPTGNTTFGLEDSFFNYQAGLVFKPAPSGSLYVSYAKSTTPPGTLIGEGQEGNAIAGNTLNNLKAEETESYEVGAKWEFFDAALGLNLALFRTDTQNARTTGPDPLVPLYVGERRIQGVEVGFNGKPLPFWSVFGGYTYMDSEVRNAGVGNVANGRPFPNTPKHSFTAWNTFDIADRFQIGGGAIYNSKQYGSFGFVNLPGAPNSVVERSIPGYWRFDATASAKVSEAISFRVNVQNLTNKRYYDRTYTTHFATVAPGRSAFATLSLKY